MRFYEFTATVCLLFGQWGCDQRMNGTSPSSATPSSAASRAAPVIRSNVEPQSKKVSRSGFASVARPPVIAEGKEPSLRTQGSAGARRNSVTRARSAASIRVSGAAQFIRLSLELQTSLDAVRGEINVADPSCPPKSIALTDSAGTVQIDTDRPPDFTGSESKLYVSSTLVDGKRVVVKTAVSTRPVILKGMIDDYAFMSVFKDSGIVPQLFPIDTSAIPQSCALRMMVSEFVGQHELKQLTAVPEPARAKALAGAAAKILEIIRAVHKEGLVHGDIHFKNFVYADAANVAGTLRLIDFGRAVPFIDSEGRNLPDEEVDYGAGWNAWHLSPWEMQKRRKTRRDDMFRIAETLLRVGGMDTAFAAIQDAVLVSLQAALTAQGLAGKPTRTRQYKEFLLENKLNRPLADSVPRIYVEFYLYCVALQALDEPDYAAWISRFQAYAATLP